MTLYFIKLFNNFFLELNMARSYHKGVTLQSIIIIIIITIMKIDDEYENNQCSNWF